MTGRLASWGLAALLAAAVAPAAADRAPVLPQVDLPHSYYWRELYLPQLTTGPSSVAFLPDGAAVVYSMAGSLWRQRIGGGAAIRLTHADGACDYQPDVAPDGRSVVFTRYDGRAMELWRLDLASGRAEALTTNGGVNVEPRISPDGSRLAYVTTAGSGHFNLVVASLGAQGLGEPQLLVAPRASAVDRYYYAAADHAINPSWSPDGHRVYFVGNREIAWGSGDIWSVSAEDAADIRRVLSEETTWSARPEPSPDGRRLLFSSYHGRQSQQLWLTTPAGAPPLPLTFGDYDLRNARWSPDGSRIAYISNERGNTGLVVQDVIGGARVAVQPDERRELRPMASLSLAIADGAGRALPARVSVLGSDGRWHAPEDAWMYGDDGFDRALQANETHYFHCAGACRLRLPAGSTSLRVQHGFRYRPWQRRLDLAAGQAQQVEVVLEADELPAEFGRWVSADLHVHMNYGGHYRNTPEHLARQAEAEDLDAVFSLIVNKEERVPDVAYFSAASPAGSRTLLIQAQEFHTSFWGHLGLLDLSDHLLLPDFSSYRHTALASPYPHNGVIADLAHAQGALVGYVHPFDWEIDPAREKTLSHQLPADVAHGKVDYLEVVGFSDHKATAAIWYRLLNLGFRLPAGAGTDAMANYASLRGPVGLNRVFLDTGGVTTPAALHAALAAGKGFASNGPLLGLMLDGRRPGDTITRPAAARVPFRIAVRSPVALDHVELVHNGRVLRSFRLAGDRRHLDAAGDVRIDRGGWLLLRAWNDQADPLVLDLYPYATTSPVYLDLPGAAASRAGDAAYFVAWMDRLREAVTARDDYNDERERRATLDYLDAARARFVELGGAAPEAGR
jgi:dipeptidyl aminopeptidase/acylaminoacyl peptidase